MESAWTRVSTSQRCPVCGKPDWCLVSLDRSAAICPRIPSAKHIDGSGYLHILKHRTTKHTPRPHEERPLPEHNTVIHKIWETLHNSISRNQAESLAGSLGLNVRCLQILGMGFSESKNSYAFPMKRKGNRTLGIRFRANTGKKFSARGGKEGLFIPSTFTHAQGVVICEGPTDTAALLGLGFNAIGRPNCTGGIRLIQELVLGLPVAIFADSDEIGKHGAKVLKEKLIKSKASKGPVVFWSDDHNDARELVASGATRTDILDMINKAKNAANT